jgi:hypothetical protein
MGNSISLRTRIMNVVPGMSALFKSAMIKSLLQQLKDYRIQMAKIA